VREATKGDVICETNAPAVGRKKLRIVLIGEMLYY